VIFGDIPDVIRNLAQSRNTILSRNRSAFSAQRCQQQKKTLFHLAALNYTPSPTVEKKIDALDNWCLSRILHIRWTDFVSNDVVRSRAEQPLLSDTIRQRRLSFFGHLCRADIDQDHSRALRACIRDPPKDWRRRTERPRQTWLKTVEDDLRPLNFGLATARRRAMDRPAWRIKLDAVTYRRKEDRCTG